MLPLRFMVLLATPLAFISSLASAQSPFPCSGNAPGQRVVATSPGGNGVAPTPLCVLEDSQDDASADTAAADPLKGARRVLLEDADRKQAAFAEIAQAMRTLASSPEQARMDAGYWRYFRDPPTATRQEGCTALFANRQGMITISSSGGPTEPVMLRYVGQKVPAPAAVTRLTIALRDGARLPQSMPALNVADPLTGMGSLGIAIRDLPSLLGVFADTGSVAVDLDGKQIYAIAYSGGAAMKRQFKACASGER